MHQIFQYFRTFNHHHALKIIKISKLIIVTFFLLVNLNTLSFGMGISWVSPVLVKLTNETETVLSEPLTDEEGSWVVSLGSLSGLLGWYQKRKINMVIYYFTEGGW